MEECPVCLEPLSGTVVLMGCCEKKLHIQCYVTKCPMCRADLPAPVHAQPPAQHVIVPVPVAVYPAPIPKLRILLANIGLLAGTSGLLLIVLKPYLS